MTGPAGLQTQDGSRRLGSQESRTGRGPSNAPPATPACVLRMAPSPSPAECRAARRPEIAWVRADQAHTVYLDNREHALTPMGVSSYLPPPEARPRGTRRRWRCAHLRLAAGLPGEDTSAVTFETPLAGPPHPPGRAGGRPASPGLLVVSWLPVTIGPAAGSSSGVPVTGCAVYADGLKVADVAEATAGSTAGALPAPVGCDVPEDLSENPSLCGESLDSVPAQIPSTTASRLSTGQRCRLLATPVGTHLPSAGASRLRSEAGAYTLSARPPSRPRSSREPRAVSQKHS